VSYFHYIYMQNSFLELPAFLMETEASLVQGYWQLLIAPTIHHKLLSIAIAVLKQKPQSIFAFLTEKDI